MDRLRYQPPHPLATEIFRAYDIRGIVDEQLSDAMLYHIGLAVGTQVKRNGEDSIAVGADGRLSSPRLSQALMAGLADTGCRVLNLGAVPTPVLYFGVKTLGTASGIMLTGSHNPSNYNGCKIVIGGHTLANDSIIALYDLIKLQDYELGIGAIEEHIIDQVYRDRIDSDVKLARPLKVVLDEFNACCISIGNPHAVIFMSDLSELESLNLDLIGPRIEKNSIFPDFANIEFACVIKNGIIRMRVWERGVGITYACGSGACATSIAASLLGLSSKENQIILDGGNLFVKWLEDQTVTLSGPTEKVFEGIIGI